MNKEEIRKLLLYKRSQQTAQSQKEKSQHIVSNVEHSDIYTKAKRIAFYHAVRGEANPKNLQSDTKKQFYLPVLSDNKNQGLMFAPINNETQYKKNRFAIPEPVCSIDELIHAESLDVVVMPLLAFDSKGNRLGMGGGFYDRCFSFKKKHPKKPVLIGFAFGFQEVEEIETEPWDIGLDAIATENRFTLLK